MIIKNYKNKSKWRENPVLNYIKSLRKNVFVITLVFIFILTAISLSSIYYGMYLYKAKKADSYHEFFENAIQTRFNIVPNFIKGYLASAPERITIDVKHNDLQKIAYKRSQALASGILMTSAEDFVPASIRYQDKTIKVRLRLKGDWIDHLLGDKWSFRIKVRGDNTLFGMKQFSIHHPKTRNYIYEWIFHQALKREDLISLRYDFIEVTLNGKNLGVYALEEHFEKRVVEHNQYREGPILKYDENYLWADRAAHHLTGNNSPTGLQAESASSIDVFKTNTILNNPVLYKQFVTAQNLIELFRRKELPTHKVFDVKKLATFFALSDLLGAEHAVMWQNLRFYFNPVTAMLEPIGFDANAGRKTIHVVGSNRAFYSPVNKFKDIAFSDQILYEEYIKELEKVSSPSYLGALLNDINDEMQENLKIIYKEFPFFHYSKTLLYQNQQAIRNVLNPAKGLHAYFSEASGEFFKLELGNAQALPVQVLDVAYKDIIRFKPAHRTVLEPKIPQNLVAYQKVNFSIPAGFVWSDTMRSELRINFKILGTSQLRQENVYSWSLQTDNFVENDFMRKSPDLGKFKFITVNEQTKKVSIKSGNWNIGQSLIIPAGYEVLCREGTKLNLTNSATILSYSPINFQGSEDYPIVIHSTDSTGQGITVVSAKEISILDYVKFDNLSNPSKNGWGLTGAVTFYESPVHFSHCQFLNNRSEDALNVIRAEFIIDKSLFKGIFSDAFDGDFTKGKISNSSFINSGNDAIDVSGSAIEVHDVFINNAGDKGLSAGENSQMLVNNVEIVNSEIAVASKDKSEITINKIKIADCEIGFTVYQKKPEFDVAIITVKELEKGEIAIPYLVEENSRLIVEGEAIATSRKNVKDILYGVEFGKSSK